MRLCLAGIVWLILLPFASAAFATDGRPELEWVSNRYADFVGNDLGILQEIEQKSQTILEGCRTGLNWAEAFPKRILVQVTNKTIPQVNKGSGGSVSLDLFVHSNSEEQAEWLTRAFLSQYSLWKGIETPPPLWLVQAVHLLGALQHKPQVRILLMRRLSELSIPSLAQRIQTYDRTVDPGWDFLLYRFLESGGLEKDTFKQRLDQFWANGYDWTQLSQFFVPRYSDLNGAELELLWRTFVGETLSTDQGACFSEAASLTALEQLSKIEVLKNNQLHVLTPDTWFLYRYDSFALQLLGKNQSKLEVLAISIHPYYFNACHSLAQVFLTLENNDLDGYREAARQWSQAMLDAQQLSFETDRLLKRVRP